MAELGDTLLHISLEGLSCNNGGAPHHEADQDMLAKIMAFLYDARHPSRCGWSRFLSMAGFHVPKERKGKEEE
jgi:hypothetical protein